MEFTMRISLLSITLAVIFSVAGCGVVEKADERLKSQAEAVKEANLVTDNDARRLLFQLNNENPLARDAYQRSVAQIVFPKIVKASFMFGANYGEGFLLRDGEVVALVDVTGGNFGLQIGAQTYSQVTYILTENQYSDILKQNRLSLSGTFSYANDGDLDTTVLSTDAIRGGFYTVTANETGSVFGASLEGLFYTLRREELRR